MGHDELYKVYGSKSGGVTNSSFSTARTDLQTRVEILTSIAFNGDKTDIHPRELTLIIEHLLKDEMIAIEDGKYRILFKGKVLIENGGYARKAFRENANTYLQVISTILIVLGTLAAGIYGIYEMIK